MKPLHARNWHCDCPGAGLANCGPGGERAEANRQARSPAARNQAAAPENADNKGSAPNRQGRRRDEASDQGSGSEGWSIRGPMRQPILFFSKIGESTRRRISSACASPRAGRELTSSQACRKSATGTPLCSTAARKAGTHTCTSGMQRGSPAASRQCHTLRIEPQRPDDGPG